MSSLGAAARVMTLLASSSERVGQLALTISRLPNVVRVSHRFEFRAYRSGPCLEAFVDAELASGCARSMWLEVKWSQTAWSLESSLLAVGADGRQEVVREFPSVNIVSLEEFEERLSRAIALLEGSSGYYEEPD